MRGMFHLLTVTAAVLLSLAGGSAGQGTSATQQAAPAQVILVLNQERLLRESRTGQALLIEERDMKEAHRQEGLVLDAELEAEELEITEKRKTLPAEEFNRLAIEFDTKVVATRREHNQRSEQLGKNLEEMRKNFFGQIVPIVAQIMQERRASMVFEQRNVLFTGPNVDITEEVIVRLDALTAGHGE